jgi:dienelactone hydrolase
MPGGWRTRRERVLVAALLALWGASSAPADPAAAQAGAGVREQSYAIPVSDGRQVIELHARLCRPAGDAPARLVVINHGSPHGAADRPRMQLGRCDSEAAQWFVSRGYVVAFALRRGYGETGGSWAEDYGSCGQPDYVHAGLETARDIDAVVRFATALPFVQGDGAVVVGQSAGGWGTIAYASLPHPKVSAFVVMAGGRGGHQHNERNHNCRPDRLVDAARTFGASARTPMLWIYTHNDSYFDPGLARAMWRAFSASGGQAQLEQLGPYGDDGHGLFFGPGGSQVWGPLVERYLQGTGAQ